MNGKVLSSLIWLIIGVVYLITVKYEDKVVFLDVGQGDATLIQNDKLQILIDGGPDSSILYQLPKYVPIYDRKIEYVVLTHPHNDHLVGLLSVLERYDVGEILYYPVCYENDNYELLLQRYPNAKEIGGGDTISLGDLSIKVVWPILKESEDKCVKSYNNDLNNDSLVLEFEYLNKRFLLMGDIESDVEEVIIKQNLVSGNYDVLKAGHHCSNSSNSETFLNTISPSLAICSVGKDNSFGHPSSETLKNFLNRNVQYLITYEQGNIQIK